MAVKSKNHDFFERLPLTLLEEIINYLPLQDIITLATCSRCLQQRLEELEPLATRKTITHRANLLKYGALLFTKEELSYFFLHPHNNSEHTRSYLSSCVAYIMITKKFARQESLFLHQTTEELNKLISVLIENSDEEILALLMQSSRFFEITDHTFESTVKYLAQKNTPLLELLLQHPRLNTVSGQTFHQLLLFAGVFPQNTEITKKLIVTPNFLNMAIENYVHLLNLTALGSSEIFNVLANTPLFFQLTHHDFQAVFEAALSSNIPSIFNFVLAPQYFHLVSPLSLSLAFQKSCFYRHHESIVALLLYPKIYEITNFSIQHSFESLCINEAAPLVFFINSCLFSRLDETAIIEGIKILLKTIILQT